MIVASITVVSVFIFLCFIVVKISYCKGPAYDDALLITPEAKDIMFEDAVEIMMQEYKL